MAGKAAGPLSGAGCRGLGEIPPSVECLASLPECCSCSRSGGTGHIPKPPRSPKQTFLYYNFQLQTQMLFRSYREASAFNSPLLSSSSRQSPRRWRGNPRLKAWLCISTQRLCLCLVAKINHQAGFLLLKKVSFPFCFFLLRHHLVSFHFISSSNMKILSWSLQQ